MHDAHGPLSRLPVQNRQRSIEEGFFDCVRRRFAPKTGANGKAKPARFGQNDVVAQAVRLKPRAPKMRGVADVEGLPKR
jgi:hypothetical protein